MIVDSDRNVLTEAARISRGQIQPLDSLDAAAFDALIFIGGFGAAKNLSSYAFDGDAFKDVDPGVIDLIRRQWRKQDHRLHVHRARPRRARPRR